jgi:hypothetical protein
MKIKTSKTTFFFTFIILIQLLLNIDITAQETITVIGWNAESGDANPDTIAKRIEEIDGCDIWGICEVENAQWAAVFEIGTEIDENADFKTILGSTGRTDKMQIIYNSGKFDLIKSYELHRINIKGRVRAPLVAHLKSKSSGTEFLFIINHLYRSNNRARHKQAALLNQWAQEQVLPIIAVGDYNFDWEVIDGDANHDYGYDNMTAGGNFYWVRPDELKKSQASTNYNSVLDFIFLGGNVWTWEAESEIMKRDETDIDDNNFSDDEFNTDHRPVKAVITIH